MPESDKPEIPVRWRWPQFSLRELLAAVTALAVLWGVLAVRLERDELAGCVVASLVLVWALLCWRTVRLNRRPR